MPKKYLTMFDSTYAKVTYYDKLLDAADHSCAKDKWSRTELHQVYNIRIKLWFFSAILDYIQDIRYSCIKHFPNGFGLNKVSPKTCDSCDSLTNKEFRKSFTSMTELQKRLNDIGGFATLRKTKTIDKELTRKVQSNHLSSKIQGTSRISLKLQKYDKLSWQEFLVAIRDTRVPLPNLPRENLIIYLTGDVALSSLDVKSLRGEEKVIDVLYRKPHMYLVTNIIAERRRW